MNTQANAIPESPLESQVIATTVIPATRRLYWSVRRELWENRSIYLAPLAVAAVALFAFSLSSIAGIWEKPLRLNPAQPQAPYDMAAGLMMLTGIVVECVLLSRRVARRAPRPQHSVLEVAAGVRCHHRACEGEHSARYPATADCCDHRRHAVAHAAGEQRSSAGQRTERRDVMDELVVLANVTAAAVPHSHGPCALARTNLLLAAARIWMAAPRHISMGGLAAGSDRWGRADCLPHLAFRCLGGVPIDRRRAHGYLDITRYVPHRPNDTYRPG